MAALLCRSVAALAALASLAAAGGNPFKDQKFYINPVNKKEYDSSIKRTSGKVKETLEEMRKVPSAYWIDVKSKTKGTGTRSVPGILKDAASKSPAELVVLIWYDLPNRDCDAKASNGEICCTANSDGTCDYGEVSDCADGIKDYEENYVEPFIAALKHYKGKVPVVIIVEPDSLPNLASNADHPHCGNPATKKAYTTCYKNAVERLAEETDASIYLDAAHGGWLGWDDNMRDFLKILDSMSLPLDRVRGFATNVANYQSLGHACPFKADQGYRNAFCLNGMHKSHKCCADPCDLLGEYNPGNGELNYAQDLIKAAKGDLSWDARVVIDTGRAGVADMRQSCKNWCNPRGSGAGPRSTTDVCMPDMVDAYFWLKTPGESDGCTQELPGGGQCKRFDTMCGSIDSIGMTSGEPKSPEAGAWFEYQVEMLAENAHLENFPCPSPSDLEPEEEEEAGGQSHSTWGGGNQQSTWGGGNSQNSNSQNSNNNQQQQPQQQQQPSPSPSPSAWGSPSPSASGPSPSPWGSPSPPPSSSQPSPSPWGSPSPPSSQSGPSSEGTSGGSGGCCWGSSCGSASCHADAFCGKDKSSCEGNCGGIWCTKSLRRFDAGNQTQILPALGESRAVPLGALASLAGVAVAGTLLFATRRAAARRGAAGAPGGAVAEEQGGEPLLE